MLITSGLLAVLCLPYLQADEELADIDKKATHNLGDGKRDDGNSVRRTACYTVVFCRW